MVAMAAKTRSTSASCILGCRERARERASSDPEPERSSNAVLKCPRFHVRRDTGIPLEVSRKRKPDWFPFRVDGVVPVTMKACAFQVHRSELLDRDRDRQSGSGRDREPRGSSILSSSPTGPRDQGGQDDQAAPAERVDVLHAPSSPTPRRTGRTRCLKLCERALPALATETTSSL